MWRGPELDNCPIISHSTHTSTYKSRGRGKKSAPQLLEQAQRPKKVLLSLLHPASWACWSLGRWGKGRKKPWLGEIRAGSLQENGETFFLTKQDFTLPHFRLLCQVVVVCTLPRWKLVSQWKTRAQIVEMTHSPTRFPKQTYEKIDVFFPLGRRFTYWIVVRRRKQNTIVKWE